MVAETADQPWPSGMTGRRVRATLGQNVLVGVAVGVNSAYRWMNFMPDGDTSIMSVKHPWAIEVLPDPSSKPGSTSTQRDVGPPGKPDSTAGK